MPSAPASSAVVVGDELLKGQTQDTNTFWLAQRLHALGYPLHRVHTIGDSHEEIVRWVRVEMEGEAVAVFVCGGLGPTPDDRTLAALADATGRAAELDEQARDHIQLRIDWLHGTGRIPTNEMSEANRRMALIPRGAVVLNNSIGMAPGLAIRISPDTEPARHIFVLPGVPREFRTIFDEEIAPTYLGYGEPHTVEEVHYDMAIEAEFWKVLRRVEQEFTDLSVGSYPQPDRGHLIIRVSGVDPKRVHEAAQLVRAEGPGVLRDP